ncbi:MAG: hypothetical protein WCF12_14420 [Propionicimonas sp.]
MIVTFVCTANICRSAYAEVVAKHQLESAGIEGLTVHSAGTWAYRGQRMYPEMAAEAVKRGAVPGGFRSRRLDRVLVEQSDLLLTAEEAHRSFVLEEWPRAFRRVVTLRQFAAAISAADPALGLPELLAQARNVRFPGGSPDVIDPYERGPAASEACAADLDALLDVIVPRLAGLG